MSNTIWHVRPNRENFWRPGLGARCTQCNAHGSIEGPGEKGFYNGRQHVRATIELGLDWARLFVLKHQPTCPSVAQQYAVFEACEKELDAAKAEIEALERTVLQIERELDRGYIAKLPVASLSQLSLKLDTAREKLEQRKQHLAPAFERLERNVAAARIALDAARAESPSEETIEAFKRELAKYLPHETRPETPGEQPKAQSLRGITVGF